MADHQADSEEVKQARREHQALVKELSFNMLTVSIQPHLSHNFLVDPKEVQLQIRSSKICSSHSVHQLQESLYKLNPNLKIQKPKMEKAELKNKRTKTLLL